MLCCVLCSVGVENFRGRKRTAQRLLRQRGARLLVKRRLASCTTAGSSVVSWFGSKQKLLR